MLGDDAYHSSCAVPNEFPFANFTGFKIGLCLVDSRAIPTLNICRGNEVLELPDSPRIRRSDICLAVLVPEGLRVVPFELEMCCD